MDVSEHKSKVKAIAERIVDSLNEAGVSPSLSLDALSGIIIGITLQADLNEDEIGALFLNMRDIAINSRKAYLKRKNPVL